MNKYRVLFVSSFLFVLVAAVFVAKFSVVSFDEGNSISGFAVHPLYSSFSAAESGSVFNNSSRLVSVNDTVVYKTAYYSVNGSAWQSFNLTGTVYSSGSSWLRGFASYYLPSFGVGEHYVIVYSCNYASGAWDCHGGKWQLLIINNSNSSNDSYSEIVIYAAGREGDGVYPNMELLIDGAVVASWVVDGDILAPTYKTYTYTHSDVIDEGNVIRVNYPNDVYGSNRDLRVDKIVVDGVTYESESADNINTGIWDGVNCGGVSYPGNEWLNCSGYIEYAISGAVACSGSATQSCSITNGVGVQSRNCSLGVWSSWGTCAVTSCNSGYVISGNACVVSSCSGNSSQSCSITNGVGVQSRNCSSGVWSSWGTCAVTSCNSGYSVCGNGCNLSYRSCSITNGVGNQTGYCSSGSWYWNTCSVVSCNSGYHISGNSCAVDSSPVCGDGSCNGVETCSSCSADCGTCPTGNVYYISASTGSDSTGNGSLSKPWKTLYKACTSATHNGDLIYVTAGTYNEIRQCPLAAGVSLMGVGDSSVITSTSSSLTYEGWPTSSWQRENASIVLAYSSTFGNGDQSISHIKFDGGNLNAARALIIMNRNNVKIHDCTFTDFKYSAIFWSGDGGEISSDPYTDAIYPSHYATGSEFYNNNVSNCALNIPWDWGRGALYLQGQEGMLIYNNSIIQTQREQAYNGYPIKSGFLRGVKIYNNTFVKIDSGSGTWMFAIEGFFYEGVEIYNNSIIGAIDINLINKTDYNYGLYVHDNILGPATSSTEYGMILEFSTSDVIIEHNTFRSCMYSIALTPRDGCVINNYRIAYNLFVNAPSDAYYVSGGSATGVNFIANNVSFYNNVFDGDALWGFSLFGRWTNFSFINNIITGTGYYFMGFRESAASNINIKNNIIYNCPNSNAPYFELTPTNYVSSNNIAANPKFVNSAAGNFHLQSTSPAINNGTNVGLTSDYEGKSVPQGSAPDIGAYEYN